MAVLPSDFQAIPLDSAIYTASQPSLTWGIDKTTNRIVGQYDGYAAVRQAVDVILHTDRYLWQIYLPSSGTDYRGLIGQDVGFVAVELKRRVWDALRMDDRVTGIADYQYQFSGDELTASFLVETVYGSFSERVRVPI